MMSIFEKLHEIIGNTHIEASNVNAVILKDDDPQSTCKNTTLKVDGKLLVCKFDQKGFVPFPFLKQESGIQEMCDYLVFFQPNQVKPKLYIFICELQSNSKKQHKAESQLRAGYNLAYFLVESAIRLLDYKTDESLIFKGVRFSTRNPQKHLNSAMIKNGSKELNDKKITYRELPCGTEYYYDNLV